MTNSITKTENRIVMPAIDAIDAIDAWNKYLALKKAVVKKEDMLEVSGNKFVKKSGWRKLATFFNLTTEIVEERHEILGKTMVWHFTIKAIAPNGRSAIGTGSCDAFEKAKLVNGEYSFWNKFKKTWEKAQPNTIHNMRSTAETRATNRAISNLIGGGEVSAEEVDQGNVVDSKSKPMDEYINPDDVKI